MLKLKYIYTALLCCCATLASAQRNFEGTLEYSMSLSGTQGEAMKAFMPNNMLFLVRGATIYYQSKGGISPSTMLLDFDSDKYYLLQPDSNRVVQMTYQEKPKDPNTPEFKATGETETMLGQVCTIYTATISQNGQTATMKLWVCEGLQLQGKPYSFTAKMPDGQSTTETIMLLNAKRDIKGLLMKMDMGDAGGMMRLQLTCTQLQLGRVDQDKLRLPAGMQIVASTE